MVVQTRETKTEQLVSGEELLTMGIASRCELVEGRIIMLSPTGNWHAIIEGRFYRAVDAFVTPRQLGYVMVGEAGIFIQRKPDTVRGADVAYISKERYAQVSSHGYLDVAPELVVEVMSPDDRWSEIRRKLQEYFAIGVKLVWVADPDSRTVSAYRAMTDVREFGEGDSLPGDDVLPGFSAPVANLFEE